MLFRSKLLDGTPLRSDVAATTSDKDGGQDGVKYRQISHGLAGRPAGRWKETTPITSNESPEDPWLDDPNRSRQDPTRNNYS